MNEVLKKIKDFYKKHKKVCILCCIIFCIAFDIFIRTKFNDSDWFTSYCEMAIEITFLCYLFGENKMTKESFELTKKEFAMTKENFEWIKKDRREEKTKREFCYLVWFVFHEFIKIYKTSLDKQDERALYSMIKDDETIKKICENIAKKTFLPQSFCEEAIKTPITSLREQLIIGEKINYVSIYDDCLIKSANNIFIKDAVPQTFVDQCKKYFNSDKEIDEIYEKLKNI